MKTRHVGSDDDALEIVEPIKDHCFGATWTMNSDRTSSWIVRFGAMPRLASAAGHAYRLKGQLLKNEFYLAGPMQRLRYTQSLLTQMAQTAVCNRHHSLDQQLCR